MTKRDVVIAEARLTVLAWLGGGVDVGSRALTQSLNRLTMVVSDLDEIEKPRTAKRRQAAHKAVAKKSKRVRPREG